MTHPGPRFYDEPAVFDTYWAHRDAPGAPNQTLEAPVVRELLGAVRGLDVLDLGCGDGAFGLELLAQGAASYLGLDASQRMVARAGQRPAGSSAQVRQADVTTWDWQPAAFDRVCARLMLHYLPDLGPVLAGVRRTLRPGGRFVASVEHPVITSCDRAWNGQGLRQAWIVDDYFRTGARTVQWMGSTVTKYHRTMEDHLDALRSAGLVLEALRESRPERRHVADEAEFERRQRIPLFLFLSARAPA